MYRMFKQFSGVFALAFAQSGHRHPQNLQLMQRHLALVFPTMCTFSLSLWTIASLLKFLPHVIGYTLQNLQFFVSAELSQRPHAMLKSFKNIVQVLSLFRSSVLTSLHALFDSLS